MTTTATSSLRRFAPVLAASLAGLIVAGIARRDTAVAASATVPTADGTALSPYGYPQERTITVTGKAAIRVQADTATITLGVVTTNPNVAEAHAKNEGSAKAIIAAAKKVGVSDKGISPGTFQIFEDRASYRNNDEKWIAPEYGVMTEVKITVTDLNSIGAILRGAVAAGANRVSVEFGTTRLRKARDQARVDAIKAAREKAALMADAAGIKLGPVRDFRETNSWWGSSQSQNINSVQNVQASTPTEVQEILGEEFGNGPITVDAEIDLTIAIA